MVLRCFLLFNWEEKNVFKSFSKQVLKDIGRKYVSISNLGLSLCVHGKNIYVERRDKLFYQPEWINVYLVT